MTRRTRQQWDRAVRLQAAFEGKKRPYGVVNRMLAEALRSQIVRLQRRTPNWRERLPGPRPGTRATKAAPRGASLDHD